MCGRLSPKPREWEKEGAHCRFCRSSWRARAIVSMLAAGFTKPQLPLRFWLTDYSSPGVGFDDGMVLATRLPKHLRYVNSHLFDFPKLDLVQPPKEALGFFHFVICSEVLEHVGGDYREALRGLRSILRQGGFAVVTVPTGPGQHEEWYPDFVRVISSSNEKVVWQDSSGAVITNHSPEFHGGTGDVLAYRKFTEDSFYAALQEAGFSSIEKVKFNPSFGIGYLEFPGILLVRP